MRVGMNYLRRDWGGKAPEVSADNVKAEHQATQARGDPYKCG